MNFTYKNHLKYYLDGHMWGYRNNSTQNYVVEVGKIEAERYQRGNYWNELRNTADLIYSDLGSDLVVFLSGGTDSEIVLRSFLSIGVKPKCITINFTDGYNRSDVTEAVEIAENLGVDLKILDFDVKNFFYSGQAAEFGSSIQCTQITYLTVYQAILNTGLPAVMGGELLLRRNVTTDPSSWYYCLRENEDCSAMRFSIKYGIPLVNEFFSYTPELMLYYLEHPSVQQLVSQKFNYKLASVSSKNKILSTLVPEIKVRKKTHGFEELLAFNFTAYRSLAAKQILRLENNLDGIEYYTIVNFLRGG